MRSGQLVLNNLSRLARTVARARIAAQANEPSFCACAQAMDVAANTMEVADDDSSDGDEAEPVDYQFLSNPKGMCHAA